MSLFVWPSSTLPPWPFDNDYTFVPADSRVRTPFEQGTARQRRTADLAYDVFQIRWTLPAALYETFVTTVDQSISSGADFFTFPIFIDSDYANCTARFQQGTLPRRERADALWQVSFALEVIDLPVMSSATLTGLIGAPTVGIQAWPTAQIDGNALNASFAQVASDAVFRDDLTSGGRIDQVRRFRQRPAIYEWSAPMTNAQYALYRGFLYWRAKKGEGWFSIPVLRGGSIENETVRIVAGTRKDTRSGGDWVASAQFETSDLAPQGES